MKRGSMIKQISTILVFLFLATTIVFAQSQFLPDPGITPDSPFYFLKTWKEQIQLFFTFDVEKKAKQYLHLAEVRLAEYQRMIEKGKQEIAERTLTKYENQFSRALQKAEELKTTSEEKASKVKDQIEKATTKHIQVLQENLAKVPEAVEVKAREELEKAIEVSQKGIKKAIKVIEEKKEEKSAKSKIDVFSDWKTYRNEQYGFEFSLPRESYEKMEVKVINDGSKISQDWGALRFEAIIKRDSSDYGLSGLELFGKVCNRDFRNFSTSPLFFELQPIEHLERGEYNIVLHKSGHYECYGCTEEELDTSSYYAYLCNNKNTACIVAYSKPVRSKNLPQAYNYFVHQFLPRLKIINSNFEEIPCVIDTSKG